MTATHSKLRLPQIEKVALKNFSLYTANPNAEFECGDRVLCLIGANGIGKSTLLSAINFCLTGIVPDPNRAFASMEEYYRFSRDFSVRYFRGRIVGTDEDDAEITIRFKLGSLVYEVRRGMFEYDQLRAFTVRSAADGVIVLATDETPRGERHSVYAKRFVEDSGLSSFEEFVFLQNFVLTFDERRKTLFWNQDVLERALYLSFGFESDMAKRADTLRREFEQEDSKVRNRQWEISRKTRRINDILAKSQEEAGARQRYDSLLDDHKSLSLQFDEETKTLQQIEAALRDENLKLAATSVKETELRDEYASYFDTRFDRRPPLAEHPLICRSLADGVCGLCGSKDAAAMDIVKAQAHATNCPICHSMLRSESAVDDDSTRFRKIDDDLSLIKQTLKNILKTVEKLNSEESRARSNFENTKAKLEAFDRQNNTTLLALRQMLDFSTNASSIEIYRDELSILEAEKQEAYDKREELKEKLERLREKLEREYVEAEKVFLPRFATLAKRFLGMPLTVQMDAHSSEGLNLVVSVRGHPRPLQQQLSESQRFFLDIALRMALTDYMSDPSARGTMLIDTPEGSLDIAYEKRAGDMLAMFSEGGHRIVMTANLNSSQLLLALARSCGSVGMKICKMTDWAELSDVQKDEEQLFSDAFQQILDAMEPSK